MNAVLTMLAQSSKFIANHTKNNRSLCHAAISEPTPLEEKNLGKIYIVLELLGNTEHTQELFHIIQDTIIYEHYHASSFEVEVAFETALQKTNEQIEKWSEHMGEEWMKNFSAVIAVVREDVVHFTSIGKAHAFLTQKEQIINILEQNSTHDQPTAVRTFSSILSGKLGKNNALFLCTESILDYISQERLRRMMIENNPNKITEKLENLLKDNAAGTNFAAIVLKMTPENEKNTAEKKSSQQQKSYENLEDSMNSLINKERQTNELLSPSLWPSFKKRWKDKDDEEEFTAGKNEVVQDDYDDYKEEKINEKAQPLADKEKSLKVEQYKKIAAKTFAIIKKIASKGLAITVLLFQKITGALKNRSNGVRNHHNFSTWSEKIKSGSRGVFQKFRHMSRGRKILLVAALIFIILFAQSVIFQGKKKETAQQQANYEQTLASVVQKIDQAKAALLYNNEDTARKFLNEAQALLVQIPQNSEGYGEKIQPRVDEITTKLQALNKIEITTPTLFADFAKIDSSLVLGKIQTINDGVVAFDKQGNGVFMAKENTEPTTVTKTTGANTAQKMIVATQEKDATGVYALLEKGLLEFIDTHKGTTETTPLEFGPTTKNITDFSFFAKKIYTLDTQNNQIWKHTASTKGFGKGEAWITDKTRDLAKGASLFIDGAIYVLESNGKVSKFFNGNKEDFRLTKIDPEMTVADKITGTEDGKNLYIFDKQGKRVVVFTKEGKFLKQFLFPALNDVEDIELSADEKNIYLLSAIQIYTINNDAVATK